MKQVRIEIAKKAWKERESGNVIQSIELLNQNLNAYESEKDWQGYIDTTIDLSICYRILGQTEGNDDLYEKAEQVLEASKKISEEKGFPLRNDWTFYMAMVKLDEKNYSKAIELYETFLQNNKLPDDRIAEVQSSIGYAKAMSGFRDEGFDIIQQNIDPLERMEPQTIEEKNTVLIKKLGAQLKLAQVLKDREESIKLVKTVQEEAVSNGLGARAKQAESLLKILKA